MPPTGMSAWFGRRYTEWVGSCTSVIPVMVSFVFVSLVRVM